MRMIIFAALAWMLATAQASATEANYRLVLVKANYDGSAVNAQVVVGDLRLGDVYNCQFVRNAKSGEWSQKSCVHPTTPSGKGTYSFLGQESPAGVANRMPWIYFAVLQDEANLVRFCIDYASLQVVCADAVLPAQ